MKKTACIIIALALLAGIISFPPPARAENPDQPKDTVLGTVIAEVAETRAGYMPELSYGSHIFQDLVEAGILYTAVFRNEKTLRYRPEILDDEPNCLEKFYPEAGALKDIVRVYDLEDTDCHIYYDFLSEKLLGLIHER